MKMPNKIFSFFSGKFKTNLFKNSFWGIFSNVFQNILFSIFFIVLARQYSTEDFANYIIANTLYSFVVGFSSLGLGHWFVRELLHTEDRASLTDKFFKTQLYIGVIFYAVNIILAYSLYTSPLVRNLSLLIGINVIFDNIIYVIRFINVAEFEQKKTFIILIVEAVLKFLIACVLFVYPIPIIYLSVLLIILRLITLNLFIRIGSSNTIHIRQILKVKVSWKEIKEMIGSNWSFVVIGSISVVYWRIGNILISKILTLADVANYEVSYKLFSMAEILPVIVSTTIYPTLINSLKEGGNKLSDIYNKAFIGYSLFGLLAFTFVFSFSDWLIPLLFGAKYVGTALYCKEMFLTILIFPTAVFQANILLTLKLEKLDMWCNIASLVINIALCFIGLHFIKSLSVINYAIFFSFIVFHAVQDIVLIKRKITTVQKVLAFYITCFALVAFYYFMSLKINGMYLFFIFWFIIGGIGAIYFIKNKNDFFPKSIPVDTAEH
ncbi:MAG: oligosaccharide flippase family protein [Ferruginibacter sp.]